MIYEAPIADQFAFPSGHTSRAAMLATLWYLIFCLILQLFCRLHFNPQHKIVASLLTVTVAVSRVVMGRHHVSDSLAGTAHCFPPKLVIFRAFDWVYARKVHALPTDVLQQLVKKSYAIIYQ